MSMQFDSQVQTLTYTKVADYLKGTMLFQDALRVYPDRPKFDILYGSALIEVEVLPWVVHPWDEGDLATVRATSCVTIGSTLNCELMQFLLTENRRMRFGAFHLDEAGQVVFSESVLGGENMDLRELQTCILSVVTIADTYDDVIAKQFGGQRASDRLPTGRFPERITTER
ncbi:MAG: YbjN domain-containing protein [Leptolyngbya sp. SIO1E4]|nr:YbjN domain-containing protein [Leptolyngbya sp. SIO1E4]